MSGPARAAELDWVELYEALRTHALGGAPADFVPLGLGVLYRRGVTAWMGCEALARSGRRPILIRESPETRNEAGLSAFKVELVRLLAGAALLTTTPRSA